MLNNGFFFQFSTKEGMGHVLENGPWLICLVPIMFNIWMPNTRLTKEEITIVAYTKVGLSLITTKLGRPIMLDAYMSTM